MLQGEVSGHHDTMAVQKICRNWISAVCANIVCDTHTQRVKRRNYNDITMSCSVECLLVFILHLYVPYCFFFADQKNTNQNTSIKLMKGKALRKHSLHEKTAASVLLKLFISGHE